MKRVLLIGGGGHCLSCMAAIESAEGYSIQGIVDASLFSSEATVLIAGYPVLGGDDRLPELLEDCDVALISVGFVDSCDARVRLFRTIRDSRNLNQSGRLAALVAGNAAVSRAAKIGVGSIVMQMALVNAGAVIGENCIINNRSLIEHGARVGDHSHISTGTIVNGDCEIGQRVFVGSGAVLRNGIRVGDDVRIGAGAVVVQDLSQPGWYVGNPARPTSAVDSAKV